MKRRQAISISLATTGGLLIGGSIVSSCEKPPYPYALFDYPDMDILNDLSDVIIPDTADAPGAKKANVGDYVQLYISDCMKPKSKQLVLAGYADFKEICMEKWGKPFNKLKANQKGEMVSNLISEAQQNQDLENPHYFSVLKQVILTGYFTSEIGMQQALRYIPIPGDQKGDIPYTKGEKSWAL